MNDLSSIEQRPSGYRSPEDKRAFKATVAAVGVIAAVLQTALSCGTPVFMSRAETAALQTDRVRLANKTVLFDGSLYFIEQGGDDGSSGQNNAWLMRATAPDMTAIEKVAEVSLDRPWLLADARGIWIVAGNGVAKYVDGALSVLPTENSPGFLINPFLFEGNPAVVVSKGANRVLKVYTSGRWIDRLTFSLSDAGCKGLEELCTGGEFAVLPVDGDYHVFYRSGFTVRHRKGLPVEGAQVDPSAWSVVGDAVYWSVGQVNGSPAVFGVDAGNPVSAPEGMKLTIRGNILRGEKWEEIFSHRMSATGLALLKSPKPGEVMLAFNKLSGKLGVLKINDGRVSRVFKVGGWPEPPSRLTTIVLTEVLRDLLMLAVAFILASAMERRRTSEIKSQAKRAQLASIWRRALAQAVDALLALALAFAGWKWFESRGGATEDFIAAGLMGIVAILAASTAGALTFFGLMEGLWGATPGKWLVGVRVVRVDLSPCGVFSGLVRNWLKAVDGWYSFLLGALVISTSEKWQRIGDQAAKTIVIRAGSVRDARST